MNREEFLRKLEAMLDGISQSEKSEAMQYYNDYFDDAGVENEQEVMNSLGSPETVAKIIKQELNEKANETEAEQKTEQKTEQKMDGNTRYENTTKQQEFYQQASEKKQEMGPWKIVAIVLLCLLLSPVILPFAASVFGLIVGLLFSVLGIVLGFGIAAIALLIAGAIVFGVGVVKIFVIPIAGLMLIGTGLLLVALGLLFGIATVALCGWFLPWFTRGVVKLCKMPFKQRGAYAA